MPAYPQNNGSGVIARRVLFLALLLMAAGLLGFALAEDTVYGTATLTYAEFYAGDVTSTEGIDAVTSATVEPAVWVTVAMGALIPPTRPVTSST